MSNIPLRNFSDYFFENIAIGAQNQLQITSICNADCVFCSNNQNPFDIERYKFRDLQEIKKIIWSLDLLGNNDIALNESLPGRISEGEAFLHPQFFNILHEIRKKFNNVISINTNGSLLTEGFIQEMSKFNPFNIRVSLPSCNKENWKKSFNMKDDDFETALKSFQLMRNSNINVSSALVPMPNWFGWDDIENTIKFLSTASEDIIIYSPGYTKHTNADVVDKMKFDKTELADFLHNMSVKYNSIINWSLNPKLQLEINNQAIKDISRQIFINKHESWWLTSKSSYTRFVDFMKKASEQIPIKYQTLIVENETYGGNIESSGLWMINDLRLSINKKLKESDKPDIIIMPGNFIDKYGFDLSGDNIIDFVDELEKKNIYVKVIR